MDKSRDLSHDMVKSNEVIGVDVKNSQKENLGVVHEIVLDKINGNVRYVVLSSNGFLGIGDKFYAIPWSAIHYEKDAKCFILNLDKEKLKNAPSFDKSHWPNMSDRQFGESISSFYDIKH